MHRLGCWMMIECGKKREARREAHKEAHRKAHRKAHIPDLMHGGPVGYLVVIELHVTHRPVGNFCLTFVSDDVRSPSDYKAVRPSFLRQGDIRLQSESIPNHISLVSFFYF